MDPIQRRQHQPDVSFDGGDLDCGGGLLLLIRRHIDPLERGGLLEILSTDPTVEVELPAWCRLTKNELVSWTKSGIQRSYLICKGSLAGRRSRALRRQTAQRRGIHSRHPTPARARAQDRAAVGDGHRQLAKAALVAPGNARPAGRQARGIRSFKPRQTTAPGFPSPLNSAPAST